MHKQRAILMPFDDQRPPNLSFACASYWPEILKISDPITCISKGRFWQPQKFSKWKFLAKIFENFAKKSCTKPIFWPEISEIFPEKFFWKIRKKVGAVRPSKFFQKHRVFDKNFALGEIWPNDQIMNKGSGHFGQMALSQKEGSFLGMQDRVFENSDQFSKTRSCTSKIGHSFLVVQDRVFENWPEFSKTRSHAAKKWAFQLLAPGKANFSPVLDGAGGQMVSFLISDAGREPSKPVSEGLRWDIFFWSLRY